MATATVKDPQGNVIATITIPEGASNEQIQQKIQAVKSQAIARGGDQKAPSDDEQGFLSAAADTAGFLGKSIGSQIAGGLSGIKTGLQENLAQGLERQGMQGAADLVRPEETMTQSVENTLSNMSPDIPSDRSQGQLQDIGNVVQKATDLANIPMSGLVGLSELATGQGLDQATKSIQDVKDNGLGETLGERALEETGNPLVATAARMSPDIALNLMGLRGANKVAGKATVKPPSVSENVKRIFRGGDEGRQSFSTNVDAFEIATGTTPTIGQASGRQSLQALESVVGKFVGGSPVRKQLDNVASGAAKKVQSIADDISNIKGAEAAGRQIVKGITGSDGFVQRFQGKSATLWNKVDDLIPENMQVELTNTKSVLDDSVKGGVFGKVLDDPKLVQINGVLDESPNVDFNTLKLLRSQIGRKLGSMI